MDFIDVPVVIVGGGVCGLNLSIILSDLKIDHVLFERHSGTSILPKAHVINQRSLEIFRQHGYVDEILEKSAPPDFMCQVAWQTSLGGDGPLDRKVLGTLDAFGTDLKTERGAAYAKDSPHISTNLPLLRSEPIFREVAERRNPAKVLFGHTVVDFADEGQHVIVHVKRADGEKFTYRASYLVGADGGKTVGTKIGVEMLGPKNLAHVVSTHFKADLSDLWDDRTTIAHFANPEGGALLASGSMLPLGPSWGRHSEEWQLHFGFSVNDPGRFHGEDILIPRIRELLKLPKLDLTVLGVSHWLLEDVVASKYQEGRVFIAGDSAHRHPPTAGLGLNTAIQDVHNLAWKLALVLNGKADAALLDTYDTERRLIGKRNADWALFTFKNIAVINAAIGLLPGQTQANTQRFTEMFDPSSEIGRASHAMVQHAIDGQTIELGAHNIELGFSYPSGALLTDGTNPPPEDPLQQRYIPTTRPGHRLPHAWLFRDGKSLSTLDLVGATGDFLLITDESGEAWVSAVKRVVESSRRGLRIVQISQHGASSPRDGKYLDKESQWAHVRDIRDGGAILVRPDNMIAWRSLCPPLDDGNELSSALDKILG
ncbi:uncharacterized protein N7479_009944 [Penicillium vulpinum]|uniref:FAD-binding domain-containing protein n=1 Tax=Penicillium vulpinum TaxID=29845 RepID=A0A1V6RYN8_9EURO|nr:uncharacterized protein N7479_009944 [Penicillium vulpinum]KAJ5951531.1 hypothetical protein N7479_009944 [Penicillium vulpinum]OQE06629.1 hypothetical protein PENVUL_c017G02641 [Penicillium vulpinum]